MKLKRFFALMLALALSLTMLQGVAFGADDYEWVESTGKLTIKTQTGLSDWKSSGATTTTLKEVVILDTAGVTLIGTGAFIDCAALTSVTLPTTGLTTINYSAFSGTALTSINIPASVTFIATNAFWGCEDLMAINVDANNPTYSSEEGILFSGTKKLYRYPPGKTGNSYIVPADVTAIEAHAFSGCTNLTSVTFESGSQLETIGARSFIDCTNLTSITIPAGVGAVYGNAFDGSGLASITFEGTPNTVGNIFGSAHAHPSTATPIDTINFAGDYVSGSTGTMITALTKALGTAGITLANVNINYNQNGSSWDDAAIKVLTDAGFTNIKPYNSNPADSGSGSVGGSGSTGSAGAGAWYIGTLNGADGQPTYTQIVDTADTTAMLDDGNVITVTGQSPTGIIVKLDPTALAGKQSLSINSSIANMQLTAEQIASLIQQADGNTIHITIKGTPDGNIISILAGGRTITL